MDLLGRLSSLRSASIWATECGNTSNAPPRSSRCMCSLEAKTKRSSMRVPPSRSVSRICTSVVGVAVFGVPSRLAYPSVNSSDVGGSTEVIRHQPRDCSPSGPVMT